MGIFDVFKKESKKIENSTNIPTSQKVEPAAKSEEVNSFEPSKTVPAEEERKSANYKSFPPAGIGAWGEEVRTKRPDQLVDSIFARIKHISGRIDSYLPPYEKNYKVDQGLALNLENSFDDLVQLYKSYIKEGYHGGYFFPEDDKGSYSYDTIRAFDLKMEEIHSLVLDSSEIFFNETHNKDMKDDEKNALHAQGIKILSETVEKIRNLIEILKSRSPIV
jgi:hypothetical protein